MCSLVRTKEILLSLFWKFSEKFLTQIVSFIISMLLARILMPAEYGLVAMVNVFLVIANVFATSGFSSALIQKKDADEEDFSTIFYCSMFVSVLIYILIYFFAPHIASFYNAPRLTSIIRVFALQLPIAGYNAILNALVARRMAFRNSFFSTVIGNILSGILGVYMAYSGYGVWALVFQSISSIFINTLVLNIILRWYPKFYFSLSRAKSLMDFGWKILFTDLLGTTFSQLSSFIIGKKYSSADLAFYNRGKQFPELITTNIDGPITAVLFPAMSKLGGDTKGVKGITRKSIMTTTFFLAPLMMGLYAVSEPLVSILLTDKWLPAVPFLQLICLERLFSTINNANIQSIKSIGRSDVLLKLEFIKKPIYIVLVIAGSMISIKMIAILQAIYGVIALFINLRPNKTFLNYSMREQISDVAPSFINAFIMAVIIMQFGHFISNNLLLIAVQFIAGVLIYAVLSFLKKDSMIYTLINLAKKVGMKNE